MNKKSVQQPPVEPLPQPDLPPPSSVEANAPETDGLAYNWYDFRDCSHCWLVDTNR